MYVIRNDPHRSAKQLSMAKPRHSYSIFALQVNPPTSPIPPFPLMQNLRTVLEVTL